MSSLRVKQSGKVIKEIILDDAKSYLAGRKEGADIFLEAAKAISREHFILKFDQFWTVEVLSRFGDIQLNNDRVRQFTLQEDSVFSIFPYDFEFIKEDPKVIGSPQSSDLGMVPVAYEHQLAVDPFPEDSYSSGGDSKGAPQPRRSVREAINEILGPWKRTIVSGLPLSDEEHDRLRDERWEEKWRDRR